MSFIALGYISCITSNVSSLSHNKQEKPRTCLEDSNKTMSRYFNSSENLKKHLQVISEDTLFINLGSQIKLHVSLKLNSYLSQTPATSLILLWNTLHHYFPLHPTTHLSSYIVIIFRITPNSLPCFIKSLTNLTPAYWSILNLSPFLIQHRVRENNQ